MSDFVDRAIELARHNAWHEQAKMESGYAPNANAGTIATWMAE